MNQRTRSVSLVFLVAALALGLGAYAWRFVFKADEAAAVKQAHDNRLISPFRLDEQRADGGWPPFRYVALTVTVGQVRTTLERRAEGWWLTSPVVAPASKTAIESVVSHLEDTKLVATLEEAPDAATLAKYGLDGPAFSVVATAEIGRETRTVRLFGGVENSFDGTVYVRRGDDPTVYSTPGEVRAALARTPDDLRERRVFTVREVDVVRITTRTPDGGSVIERDAQGVWTIAAPFRAPADLQAVVERIGTAGSEKARAFPSDGVEVRRALGFDAPAVDTTLDLADETTVRLRVCRVSTDGGDTWFGLREDEDGAQLAALGPGIAAYGQDAAELVDRKPLRFDAAAVMRVVLRVGTGPELVLERETSAPAEWRVVVPRRAKAKGSVVVGALNKLASLRALKLGEAHPADWGRFGLVSPSRSVSLFGAGGQSLGQLTLGAPVADQPGLFYLRGRLDQVLLADGNDFKGVPFTLAELLDAP